MKASLTLLTAAAMLSVPGAAIAKPVTITAKLADYGGYPAYIAVYVVDKAGAYQKTLWVAGSKARYYRHLSAWERAAGRSARLDGITGASIGSGRSLTVHAELADTMIDAGYRIQVDTAYEEGTERPAEVAFPLEAARAGKPVAGRGTVQSFTVSF
ncbi:MAG: DUF2271 domain-containing protein [Ancalomicrobiaceae bacterium]|nr:DUF2271 domain-containing protein [Ancalomicrobiaceae bacterium]